VSASEAGYQVGPDTRVELTYAVYDAEGEEVDRSPADAPLTVIFGYGQLLPAVEHAISGLRHGQSREVYLAPSQGYGERDPKAIIEVDRADFPPDVAPGDRYEVENEKGELLVLQVLDVLDDAVVLDTNHPLAGQRVRVELTVRDVRPATSAELSSAQARLEAPEEEGPGSLISADRLLRGRTQR
jgi:FKBP-type peptidyl-prolyl cis-trans isomerase SlyD